MESSSRPPFLESCRRLWFRSLEKFRPEDWQPDAEEKRHGDLIAGFSIVGGGFALGYAAFYLWIGHYLGAGIILGHSMVFSTLPFWLRKRRNPSMAGAWLVFALTSLVTMLSILEGGVRGHAVAWLATIPVCAHLLLAGGRAALGWSLIAVALAMGFGGVELAGVEFPLLYDPALHGVVTLVGYTGLALFMLSLGFLSEAYRREAVRQRDRAWNELKMAAEELEQLNEEKNEFLGIAAHDLNNPLNVVMGYAQVLETIPPSNPEEIRDYAGRIKESTRRMALIIRDVLDVNRIESGEYPLDSAERALKPVTEACVERYRAAAEAKSLDLRVVLEKTAAYCDAGAYEQVLDNLVSNAVKYADPGGRVEVVLRREGDSALLRVYNDGSGFSEEDKQKLFCRFAKLSTRPTGGESSTGLGLSIARKIVTAMGGRIDCESTQGEGATFEVRLPVKGEGGLSGPLSNG